MSNINTNNKVAKELSDAMARCKQQGVDEQTLRTGLLTITIANFVNRMGMGNTVALFEALPEQITSGIFDRYIDPNTNTHRSYHPATVPYQPSPPNQGPQISQQAPHALNSAPYPPQPVHPSLDPRAPHPEQSVAYQQSSMTPSYQNASLPQNFIPPYPAPPLEPQRPGSEAPDQQRRRRLPE